jgi:hypothetical protein
MSYGLKSCLDFYLPIYLFNFIFDSFCDVLLLFIQASLPSMTKFLQLESIKETFMRLGILLNVDMSGT